MSITVTNNSNQEINSLSFTLLGDESGSNFLPQFPELAAQDWAYTGQVANIPAQASVNLGSVVNYQNGETINVESIYGYLLGETIGDVSQGNTFGGTYSGATLMYPTGGGAPVAGFASGYVDMNGNFWFNTVSNIPNIVAVQGTINNAGATTFGIARASTAPKVTEYQVC